MQSKLKPAEKAMVRQKMVEFEQAGGCVIAYPSVRLTLALLPHFPGSKWATMGVAYCSPSEKKFRNLVGVNIAMYNAMHGGIPVCCNQENFRGFAQQMAQTLQYLG